MENDSAKTKRVSIESTFLFYFVMQCKKLCYIQPPVAKCFRPAMTRKSLAPIQDATVHKTSFLPIDSETAKLCRMPITKPDGNLNLNKHIKMEDKTVTSISYQPIPGLHRSPRFMPIGQIGLGDGQMQQLTTHKHDYCFKRTVRPEPMRPKQVLESKEPFESETTTRLSYQKPEGFRPNPMQKPDQALKMPNIPLDLNTCYKLSYQPRKTLAREIPPWAKKGKFQKPVTPMDTTTIYKRSYEPPGEFVLVSEDEVFNTYEPTKDVEKNVLNNMYPKAAF